jgi:hypothetical protein
LISAILGTFSSKGYLSGVVSLALYGVGMALLVTALTVTLAFASSSLLLVLRNALKYVDRVAAVFIMATGMYLTWYWYSAISDRGSDGLTGRVEGWQGTVVNFLQRQGVWKLAIVLRLLVAGAIAYVVLTKRDEQRAQ